MQASPTAGFETATGRLCVQNMQSWRRRLSTVAHIRTGRRSDRRTQLPDHVAAYLRDRIMSGHLLPGEHLRMEPIAEAVGVSITPVREALFRLRNEGFLIAVPRRGFVVASFTEQDVRDLFWAQSRIAGELAARAARRITGKELDQLTLVMQQYDAAAEQGDVDEIGQLGHRFHRIINLAAGSDRLALLLAGMVTHLPNQFYASFEAHTKPAGPQHHEILDALCKGESKRARRITKSHIMLSADHVIEDLEQRGLWRSSAPVLEPEET